MMKLIEIKMRLKPFNLQLAFERLVIYINYTCTVYTYRKWFGSKYKSVIKCKLKKD